MPADVTDAMIPAPCTIRRVRPETRDTFTLELTRADGAAPPPFRPGQFNMLYVPGAGEVPLSISGDPADAATLTHTVRAVGAVTTVLRTLGPGDVVGIRGPYGVGWPIDRAEGHDVMVIAGGIGLAPLRPAMLALLAQRPRFGRISLLYGTRTPADLLYPAELDAWHARPDIGVLVTVDRAAGGWRGHVGVVTSLIARARFQPERTIAMMCGPEVMMRFTAAALADRGVSPSRTFLSMERNMKCGIGLCGHCQYGAAFVCRDGPVFPADRIAPLLAVREA